MEALQLNEVEQQGFEDLKWAQQAPEVQQHAGKLVAVHQKRVLGVGTDRDALVASACANGKCAWQDLVVVVVSATDFTELPR